jgi:hypothetical protein
MKAEIDNKKLDKEKIEQFVSLGIPKLLAAAYAKAVGGVTVMKLVNINEKNGKLKYAPVPEEQLTEALMYIQEHGNNVENLLIKSLPQNYNVESGELPETIVFLQQEPDIRAFEILLAHSIGRPTESIKVEQETKVLHVIAEEAMKRKELRIDPAVQITSPFSPWKKTNS